MAQGTTVDVRTLTIDVRTIFPRDRHPVIFSTFERLKPGEGFELVSDHDPKPLYFQFRARLGAKFDWQSLEQGPALWRVRIGRTAA